MTVVSLSWRSDIGVNRVGFQRRLYGSECQGVGDLHGEGVEFLVGEYRHQDERDTRSSGLGARALVGWVLALLGRRSGWGNTSDAPGAATGAVAAIEPVGCHGLLHRTWRKHLAEAGCWAVGEPGLSGHS